MNWVEDLEKIIILDKSHLEIYNVSELKKQTSPHSIWSGPDGFRSFSVHYDAKNQSFSVFLIQHPLIKNNKFIGYCSFCGIYPSIEEVFYTIRDWQENNLEEDKIALKYGELTRFKEDKFKHPNIDHEEAWTKVKILILNNFSLNFDYIDFRKRYEILISKAKRRKELMDLFPFTSLNALCFRYTVDYDFNSPSIGGRIWPNIENTEGKAYCVDKQDGIKYFEEIEGALDYFCEGL